MSHYAGFDLGGTRLKYGMIDDENRIVFQESAETPQQTEELISLLEVLWKKMNGRVSEPVSAAGFGFPGILSNKTRRILNSPNYQAIENIDLYAIIGEFVKVPFIVDNDANAAAFGEFTAGAGEDSRSMVLLTIGTGVGSGIILDGKLWQGACGFGGELGHLPVNHAGEACNCGSFGCLETEASGPKIVRNYLNLGGFGPAKTSKDVYQHAVKGDPAAHKAFSLAGRFLGIGIAAAINTLNPDSIVLGGGVMAAGDLLFKPAVEEARRRSYRQTFECCSIRPARLGNDAGFIGAACRARELLRKP